MILKASEFQFPEKVRFKYFPLVVRSLPSDGWPERTVVVTEEKAPYRNFLQLIGAPRKAEFNAEIGEYQEGDSRILLSMLEEIALNCPLKEEEVVLLKRDYEVACRTAGEKRPPLFVHGLIPEVWLGFESGTISFSAALILSLYTSGEIQREIVGLGLGEESPEALLRPLWDPFFAGDLFNRMAKDPARLKRLGYESLSAFLRKRSPLSYGRARFLMRLAAAIPWEKRDGLTGDHGELLLTIGRDRRETLFRGGSISVYGGTLALKDLKLMGRPRVRHLLKALRRNAVFGKG